MDSGSVIVVSICVFFGRLALESLLVARAKRKIPLRICVTGTRGKSSVTRLIAAGLRAGDRRVLAKATGTEAVLILPDGSETPVGRRGKPNILEQARLLRRAAKMGVDAIVFEVMSIHPETQLTETGKILDPGVLAVTNIRLDHLPAPSGTRSDVAGMLALSIPRRGVVVTPSEELVPEIEAACELAKARLILCPPLEKDLGELIAYEEFEANLRLALTVCEQTGVARNIALKGMLSSRPDSGRLALSRLDPIETGTVLCVSAFAANDPESTFAVLEKAEKTAEGRALAEGGHPVTKIGVLNVRKDRGERTIQWIEWLGHGRGSREPSLFDLVFVIGDPCHGRAAAHSLRSSGLTAKYASCRDPSVFTRMVCGIKPASVFIFGFGNIGGSGRILADYWASRKASE